MTRANVIGLEISLRDFDCSDKSEEKKEKRVYMILSSQKLTKNSSLSQQNLQFSIYFEEGFVCNISFVTLFVTICDCDTQQEEMQRCHLMYYRLSAAAASSRTNMGMEKTPTTWPPRLISLFGTV